jgi:Coenzyme PQQ synthesis protein D (PqqD)
MAELTHGPARVRTRRGADRRTIDPDRTVVRALGAFGWTIAFLDCPEVAAGLEAILTGWELRRLPAAAARRADAQIKKTRTGFAWTSHRLPKPELWDAHPPTSAMQAVCDIHDVLFDWFLKANATHLCLHGAAVRIGRGLVCFPSVQRAGKSTMCVALAARGHTVFGDDVVAIEPGRDRGAAFGIAPRLRKPLPSALGAQLLRFVRQRAGPSDRRWTYVRLGRGEIAPLGTAAPITAFVLLQRGDGGTKLEPVGKSEMLMEILLQNFARQVPPVQLLDRLMRLVERAACYRLHYGPLGSAVRLIENRFEHEPPVATRRKITDKSRRSTGEPRATPSQDLDPACRFRRAPGVETREVGGEIFVAAPGPKTIHHLDRVASAAWRALREPKSAAELIALFAAAFPQTPRRKIVRDVMELLGFLQRRGLIATVGARPSKPA